MPWETTIYRTVSKGIMLQIPNINYNHFWKWLILKIFLMFIFWERERVWAGEGQRERETQNPKQAPGSELSARSPTRGSNPQTVRSWPEPVGRLTDWASQAPPKVHNSSHTLWPNNSIPGHIPNRNECLCPSKGRYRNVQSSLIHCSSKTKTTQMSIGSTMGKYAVL